MRKGRSPGIKYELTPWKMCHANCAKTLVGPYVSPILISETRDGRSIIGFRFRCLNIRTDVFGSKFHDAPEETVQLALVAVGPRWSSTLRLSINLVDKREVRVKLKVPAAKHQTKEVYYNVL